MVSAISASLSGLSAASLRIGVASNNIANLQSTTTLRNGEGTEEPFTPQEVVQSSDANGGVRATVRDATSSDEGTLEKNLINLIIGGYDFRANLKVLQAEDKKTKSLLDIFT